MLETRDGSAVDQGFEIQSAWMGLRLLLINIQASTSKAQLLQSTGHRQRIVCCQTARVGQIGYTSAWVLFEVRTDQGWKLRRDTVKYILPLKIFQSKKRCLVTY